MLFRSNCCYRTGSYGPLHCRRSERLPKQKSYTTERDEVSVRCWALQKKSTDEKFQGLALGCAACGFVARAMGARGAYLDSFEFAWHCELSGAKCCSICVGVKVPQQLWIVAVRAKQSIVNGSGLAPADPRCHPAPSQNCLTSSATLVVGAWGSRV